MNKNLFGSYLQVLLFIAATLLILSVSFTLITGISPLAAFNLRPLSMAVLASGLVLAFIVLPIVVNRIRDQE